MSVESDPLSSPPVTVIVATHNRPELLRVAIDSILGQTYRGAIECLVVYDQSEPDHTLAMVDGDRSIRLITNDRTPGLAGARNSGVLATDRDFVAFCDDDDSWLPTKLERQMELLVRSGALTSVTGIYVQYADRVVERIPSQATFTLEHVARSRAMEGHPSTVVVRRDAFLGPIGLVDEQIPGSYGEDFDWMLRALAAGPVAVVEEPLATVLWGQSLFSRRWQTIIDAIDYGLAKHTVFHADRKALARLYGRRAFANAALGNRKEALRGAWRTARKSPAEKRVVRDRGRCAATRVR